MVWLIVLPVVVVAIVLANRSSTADNSKIDHLAVGDCIAVPAGDVFDISNIEVVDCAKPHNNEVYAIGTLKSAIGTTTNADDNPEIVRICRTDVNPSILAVLAHTDGVTPGVITRKDKAGRLVCTANTASRTGSLLASVTS